MRMTAATPLRVSPTNTPARNASAPASTTVADHGSPQARNGRGSAGALRRSAKSATQQTH